jgi:hypothetical protein
MTPARPAGTLAVVVPMASAVPEGAIIEGLRSLEVRWIFPGQLDTAMAGWFPGSQPETESREDDYLLDPGLGGLSVKVRAGRTLDVKMFLGSPGNLDLPGRARGRMQYWRKWSFPFSPLRPDSGDPGSGNPGGWRRVRKQRRVIWFSPSGERVDRVPAVPGPAGLQARYAVELTELRVEHQDWWSLGLEATGPAGALRDGLQATAALVFSQALPGGVDLRIDDSRSYADWLRSG